MFPDKAKILFVVFAVAPVVFLVEAALVTFGRPAFVRDPSIIPVLFIGLALVSLAGIGMTVFVQTSTKLMSAMARYDPIGRTFQIMALGAILSETHAIFGLVLALLSSVLLYGTGFSIVTWASLWWVRKRFRQSLPSLPDA
jgi:F0F1-type ATP synthase membrane subunit c/vacuolar-type H+-ATPase subunit K